VCNPLPEDEALQDEEINNVIESAIVEAEIVGIAGADLTPFLLERINQITKGRSMQANLALLKNNARLAALIAKSLAKPKITNF
jgi:pseudouridine-5'-phosphate glycosidase